MQKDKRGTKKLINSFKYAFKGIVTAYKDEQNFMIHCIITVAVVILGFLLKISYIEWIIVVFAIGLVLSMELINTAIEALVDLATEKINPLAKTAKDVSAAAVFMMALTAAIVGTIIFLPKLLDLVWRL